MNKQYDYIIAGAGCAGLSLLFSMMQHAFFSSKKILLIDKASKNQNDRTWCFWEQQPGLFEDIVYHRWPQIDFFSNSFSARFDLEPYTYKMIRGIDLYETVLNKAAGFPNITVIYDEVMEAGSDGNTGFVKTNTGVLTAPYVFNSILPANWKQEATRKNDYLLLQHFSGWLIETPQNFFNSQAATFMDFRVSQENGNAFVYVLPVAKNRALIEYTVFSGQVLPPAKYNKAIELYINNILQINEYIIQQKEQGVIPMTSYRFAGGTNNVINIGTAGGQTKSSTGFTFQYIQKHTKKITGALLKGENPMQETGLWDRRFRLYDDILLNVLVNEKMKADELFAVLFKKNAIETILRFLDNESTFKQELKIMRSVPLGVFLPAAASQLIS